MEQTTKSKMQDVEFEMAMTCDGCAKSARKVLEKLGDEVIITEIDPQTKKVKVTTSLDVQTVKEQLEKTGKEVKLLKS